MTIIDWVLRRPIRAAWSQAAAEHERLSHCHRCGACLCYWHNAYAADSWEEHRVICQRCVEAA